MLNLASPELNSTRCLTSSRACKSSTGVGICCQRKETAVKNIFSPKRDLGKVILLHDLFILSLHGTHRSDVDAEPRGGETFKEPLKAYQSQAGILGTKIFGVYILQLKQPSIQCSSSASIKLKRRFYHRINLPSPLRHHQQRT